MLRRAELADLSVVASWIRSPHDCALWAGARVAFPIELAALPEAIEMSIAESWCYPRGGVIAGFGQLVPKDAGRIHLARVVVDPAVRRQGIGTRVTEALLSAARSRQPPRISLNVSPGNLPAERLYRGLGFAPAARPRDEWPSRSLYMELERMELEGSGSTPRVNP